MQFAWSIHKKYHKNTGKRQQLSSRSMFWPQNLSSVYVCNQKSFMEVSCMQQIIKKIKNRSKICTNYKEITWIADLSRLNLFYGGWSNLIENIFGGRWEWRDSIVDKKSKKARSPISKKIIENNKERILNNTWWSVII